MNSLLLFVVLAFAGGLAQAQPTISLVPAKNIKVLDGGVVRQDGLLSPWDIRESSNAVLPEEALTLSGKTKTKDEVVSKITVSTRGQSIEDGNERFEISFSAKRSYLYDTRIPLIKKIDDQDDRAFNDIIKEKQKKLSEGDVCKLFFSSSSMGANWLIECALGSPVSFTIRSKSYQFIKDLSEAKHLNCTVHEAKVSTLLKGEEMTQSVELTKVTCAI